MTDLSRRVTNWLDTAASNGYDVWSWPVDDIVADLHAFEQDAEDIDTEVLRKAVVKAKEARNGHA